MHQGKAIIFSAPSGAGKTTIVQHLIEKFPQLGFSISACTRDKRGRTEVDGVDYYFLTVEDFKNKIDNNEFVEWEEVYEGNFYGTLKEEIERIWSQGKHVIFDVDVKGGIKLKEYFGDKALAIFVKVPSIEILEQRLTKRNSESSSSLSQRLYKAKFEMTFEDRFDETLVNEDLQKSLVKAEELVSNFLN
ncbi:guanylate kinase [Marivirga atlantica]|jgi:guanylate kinase|uniref:Guanylate kinase n=1 Tax=Marivirga atlantica TaxID=1548457 RepID=A0A937AE40_9BACT|nr:guanylate kinase [Marivirga atlantica]MBL0764573.1 guanylate kinase [Marivirga atlantica]